MNRLSIYGAFSVLFLHVGFSAELVIKFDPSQLISGKIPKPDYSSEARAQHLTGNGLFIVNVDSESGYVTNVIVEKSTGHRILDNSCLKTLKDLRFKKDSVTKVRIPVSFELDKSNEPAGPTFVTTMDNRPRDKTGRYLSGNGVALATLNPNTGEITSIRMFKSTGYKE